MNRLLSFKEKDTWIHRLSGVTKLLFFLLWCITSALTYDTRVLIAMIIISLCPNIRDRMLELLIIS